MTDRDTGQAHDLFELLRKRRMHRRFTGEPVPKEAIEKLVWAAGRAPAGGNVRMRNLLVVTDPAVLTTLRQVTPSFGATGSLGGHRPVHGHRHCIARNGNTRA